LQPPPPKPVGLEQRLLLADTRTTRHPSGGQPIAGSALGRCSSDCGGPTTACGTRVPRAAPRTSPRPPFSRSSSVTTANSRALFRALDRIADNCFAKPERALDSRFRGSTTFINSSCSTCRGRSVTHQIARAGRPQDPSRAAGSVLTLRYDIRFVQLSCCSPLCTADAPALMLQPRTDVRPSPARHVWQREPRNRGVPLAWTNEIDLVAS
jgi:hypothetical protein